MIKLHPYQETILQRIIRGDRNLVFGGGQQAARTMTTHLCAVGHSINEKRTITLQTTVPVEKVKEYFQAFSISYTFNPTTNRFDGFYQDHPWSIIIKKI